MNYRGGDYYVPSMISREIKEIWGSRSGIENISRLFFILCHKVIISNGDTRDRDEVSQKKENVVADCTRSPIPPK